MEITGDEFRDIAELVYKRFGINLTDRKVTLVKGRLNKLIRSKGFTSFREYYDYVVNDSTGAELLTLVDKISTNHTYFYREEEHFSVLRSRILPEITSQMNSKDPNELRIWSAGCSSGEEPYTLAIELIEHFKGGIPFRDKVILATDISLTVLESAGKGLYTTERLKNVDKQYLTRYFTKTTDTTYQVKNELKSLVLYKRLNLMQERYPFRRQFHMIFCRNVMIYFDKPTKDRLVEQFAKHLVPGGYLFIGHSETLGRESEVFQYVQPALYRKRER